MFYLLVGVGGACIGGYYLWSAWESYQSGWHQSPDKKELVFALGVGTLFAGGSVLYLLASLSTNAIELLFGGLPGALVAFFLLSLMSLLVLIGANVQLTLPQRSWPHLSRLQKRKRKPKPYPVNRKNEWL